MTEQLIRPAAEDAKAGLPFLRKSDQQLTGRTIDQFADLKQVDVILGVSLFAGTGEYYAFVVVVNALEKFAHFRKRSDLRKIFFSKYLGPVFIQLFAETFDFLGREKLG